MRNITVKNIPDDLYEKLKISAKINRRSINNEIIVCIDQTIQNAMNNPELTLERARKIRRKTTDHPINDEEFNRIKGDNRL